MRTPDLFFQFQLAEELGMTVGALRRQMSADELTHWKAYHSILARERKKTQNKK